MEGRGRAEDADARRRTEMHEGAEFPFSITSVAPYLALLFARNMQHFFLYQLAGYNFHLMH